MLLLPHFRNFLRTFLFDAERTLDRNGNELILNIEGANWPLDITHWLIKDRDLNKIYNDGTLDTFFKTNMPNAIWR